MACAISLEVRVGGHREAAGGHTVYNVETLARCRAASSLLGEAAPAAARACAAERRYSEFLRLHALLAPLLPQLPAAFPVPKSFFHGEQLRRERAAAFHAYLHLVLAAAPPLPPPPLCAFLAIDLDELRAAAAAAAAEAEEAVKRPAALLPAAQGDQGAEVAGEPSSLAARVTGLVSNLLGGWQRGTGE